LLILSDNVEGRLRVVGLSTQNQRINVREHFIEKYKHVTLSDPTACRNYRANAYVLHNYLT